MAIGAYARPVERPDLPVADEPVASLGRLACRAFLDETAAHYVHDGEGWRVP